MTRNTEPEPPDPEALAVSLINHLRTILKMLDKRPRQRRRRKPQ